MNDKNDETIRSVLATMVGEAPTPTEFDHLTTVTAADAATRRRRSPIAAVVIGFATVMFAIGAISTMILPLNGPSSDGQNATIFFAPTYMPEDLTLQVGEVSPEEGITTQIYVGTDATGSYEDIRDVSINVLDISVAIRQAGQLTADDPEIWDDSSKMFAQLLSTADELYAGQDVTYEETELRGHHTLIVEHEETGSKGNPVPYISIATAEGNGIYSEIIAHNLLREEAIAIAMSIRPIPRADFPVLSSP